MDEEEEEEEEEEAAEELPVPKPQRDIRHRPDATRILTTEDFQLIGDTTSYISSHQVLQSHVLPVLLNQTRTGVFAS
jgi:hypothetical protein